MLIAMSWYDTSMRACGDLRDEIDCAMEKGWWGPNFYSWVLPRMKNESDAMWGWFSLDLGGAIAVQV
jgi:hypothetical protein